MLLFELLAERLKGIWETDPLSAVLGTAIFLAVYFLPTFIAITRAHQNLAALIALNALTGWTFLGWVACTVWAFTVPPEHKQPMKIIINTGGRVVDEQEQARLANPFEAKLISSQPSPARFRCSGCKTPILHETSTFCAGCGKQLQKRLK